MKNVRDYTIGEIEAFILMNGPDYLNSDPVLTDNERQIVLNAIGTLVRVIPRCQNAMQSYKVKKVEVAMSTPQPEPRKRKTNFLGISKRDQRKLEDDFAICTVIDSF